MIRSRTSRLASVAALIAVTVVMLTLGGCSSKAAHPLAASVAAPVIAQPTGTFIATMVRDVDGDTVIARRPGSATKLRVRIVGIDTPESVKPDTPVACFGHEASAFTKALLPVGVTFTAAYESDHQDQYGRELWDVWLPDGRSLEAVLAASGAARPDPFPPNVEHADVIDAAATVARTAHRGLWGSCGFAKSFPDQAREGITPDGTKAGG